MKQARLLIEGKVQGVFFRASAKEEAERLGVSGFARNKTDGGVEILAQGEEETLNRFIDWCKKGPSSAKVEKVDARRENITEKQRGFQTF